MKRIITLTTDFGLTDGFVGVMKGVILSINPDAMIIDITHDIAPQNIEQGAFVFANAYRYFPPNAIHVVIVDPGVGSARRPIAMQIGETIFVAPDNGILSLEIGDSPIQCMHLTNPKFWLPRVSNTFHGCDIFSPVAAHLSMGVPIEKMGEPMDDWVRLPQSMKATREGNEITGQVVHIDRFGNVITNISEEMLIGMDRAKIVIRIGDKVIRGIRRTYADGQRGEIIALISSSWNLELAIPNGNAANEIGTLIGSVLKTDIDNQ
jgi:S-adenosyl-L-methionine hydrolase (adenosine-forming)